MNTHLFSKNWAQNFYQCMEVEKNVFIQVLLTVLQILWSRK